MTLHTSHNRKVWQAAAILVDRYGKDAPAIAEQKAAQLENTEGIEQVVWNWIAEASLELLRTRLRDDEKLH